MPTIEIPRFGGQITEFKHFYDTFNSLIINNQVLDDVKKIHYVLSSATNEAHQLIQNLLVTQQNFHIAWNLLCDRYNSERLIAAAHVVIIVTATDQQGISHRRKSIDKSVLQQFECY